MLQEDFEREMLEKENAILQEQERVKAEREELKKKQYRLFQLASSFDFLMCRTTVTEVLEILTG